MHSSLHFQMYQLCLLKFCVHEAVRQHEHSAIQIGDNAHTMGHRIQAELVGLIENLLHCSRLHLKPAENVREISKIEGQEILLST